MTFLNTEQSVLEKVSTDKKTQGHSLVCIARKAAGEDSVFYNLWSGSPEEYITCTDFPYYDKPPTKSVEYTPFVKINEQWYTFDWWWWYCVRYEKMKLKDALDKIASGHTPSREIQERYVERT